MVNRTGAVRFFYAPATDLQWGCATTNVGSCDAVEQLLTHASFCSYKGLFLGNSRNIDLAN